MRRLFILSIAIFLILGFTHSVNAILIDLDNNWLPPSFSTENIAVPFPNTTFPEGSGYDNMQNYTNSDLLVFNPGIPPDYIDVASPSSISSTENFDLTSFLIAGAWGNQTLLIEGLVDDSVIYSSALAVTPTVQLFEANWYSIDQLRITIDPNGYFNTVSFGDGQNWVADNLVLNENAAPVPEPSTIVLLGLGLVGLAGIGKKKMKH